MKMIWKSARLAISNLPFCSCRCLQYSQHHHSTSFNQPQAINIDKRCYWVRDHQEQKQFNVYWKPSKGNKADYTSKQHPAPHQLALHDDTDKSSFLLHHRCEFLQIFGRLWWCYCCYCARKKIVTLILILMMKLPIIQLLTISSFSLRWCRHVDSLTRLPHEGQEHIMAETSYHVIILSSSQLSPLQ